MIETIMWRILVGGSRIRTVEIDSLRGPVGIRRMDRLLNVQIREM